MPDPISITAIAGGSYWLLDKVLGPTATQIGENLRDRLFGFGLQNIDAIIATAQSQVQASGISPKQIPLRTTVALLEGMSREDNPEMQKRWAALLANAATVHDVENEVPVLFPHILAQLTPLAANLLELLYQVYSEEKEVERVYKGEVNDLIPWGLELGEMCAALGIPTDRFAEMSIDLALSLGLVAHEPFTRSDDRDPASIVFTGGKGIDLTTLGRNFVGACRPRQPRTAGS